MWLLIGRIIFLTREETSLVILIGRITFLFTCEKHRSSDWLKLICVWKFTFFFTTIYDNFSVTISQYVYNRNDSVCPRLVWNVRLAPASSGVIEERRKSWNFTVITDIANKSNWACASKAIYSITARRPVITRTACTVVYICNTR